MIYDKQNLFSEDQALTAEGAADSTNIIDLGLTKMGEGEPIDLNVRVSKTFVDGTSIKVSLVTSATSTFASTTTMLESAAIATASLVAGYQFAFGRLPDGMLRYAKLVYTLVGTYTAGTVFAGLNLDRQNWAAQADAL